MSEKMTDNFFNFIPKEKTLDHKIIGPRINKLIEFFINKIDREFPHDRIRNKNAKGMFLTFTYVAKNTYRSILFLCDMVSKDPGRKIEYSISSIPLLRVILEEVFTMLFFSEKLDERMHGTIKLAGEKRKRHMTDVLPVMVKMKIGLLGLKNTENT